MRHPLDMNTVLLRGGVADIGPRFHQPARAALTTEVHPPDRPMPVLTAALGNQAALLSRHQLTEAVH